MANFVGYIYILATICLTVFGQLIIKWRIAQFAAIQTHGLEKLKFLLSLLIDPYIISGFAAAFLASLSWMAAMTKFELSYAYPFMSLNFVIVLLLSSWILSEALTAQKIIGVVLIVFGTFIASRG